MKPEPEKEKSKRRKEIEEIAKVVWPDKVLPEKPDNLMDFVAPLLQKGQSIIKARTKGEKTYWGIANKDGRILQYFDNSADLAYMLLKRERDRLRSPFFKD
jgi:hypothetical protein